MNPAIINKYEVDKILVAISVKESGVKDDAIGAAHERGRYQLTPAVWEQHTKVRRWSFIREAHLPMNSYCVARDHLEWLSLYYSNRTNRKPTVRDLAIMWNMGANGYRKRGFQVKRVPKIVQKYSAEVVNIYMKGGK